VQEQEIQASLSIPKTRSNASRAEVQEEAIQASLSIPKTSSNIPVQE
jgi:hypothetical protein